VEENRIPKRVLGMKLEATKPRGRLRNRWQDKVREDGSIVGREEWQGKVYERGRMEEASEDGKESPHSAHANGIINGDINFIQIITYANSNHSTYN
jgi:hypothetical protein